MKYYGTIVDIIDPEKLGRVKVRVHGKHDNRKGDEYNIDEDIYSDDSVSFISLGKIHLFALVNYLKKDNNIIYIGIFLIIISILLYFINITRRW